MQPKTFFKDEGLLALMSDASIDFTCVDFDAPLTAAQRAYLQKGYGADIAKVFWRKQVHSDDILVAQGGVESVKSCPDADAYITDEKNLPIAIRTADCVPVFIFDPLCRVIGLAHAGWKGTYKAIAAKTVQKMKEKYASPSSSLKIFLGPSIRECCYQVGGEFRDHFPSYVKTKEGFLYADMISAIRDQLLKVGVRQENIFDSGICTCCNKNYFSFRRDGEKAGRMISLMMLV
jgi:YfiH family protein